MDVTLASGGPAVPGIAPASVRLVQLPPASAADLTFKKLLDEAGREIDDDWRRRRSEALQAAWRAADAQVLLIELFPFGRRQMRFELLPLLDAAKGRAAIACSVRDILGGLKSPERRQETLDLVERYFDRVLVHGDPGVVPFEQTFPGAERIAGRLSYTGYVVEPENENAPGSNAGRDEIIVSAGGGAVGAGLLEAAMRAKPLTSQRDRTWRMLAGNNLPEEDFRRLAGVAAGDGRIVLERSRADFTTLLANCALSVSQAGYNTLMETVSAGARAVVVPFSGGHETEQALRARSFADRGLLEMVDEGALTPQSLAAAIDRAARKPRPAPGAIDLDGARKSALLIAGMIRGRFP